MFQLAGRSALRQLGTRSHTRMEVCLHISRGYINIYIHIDLMMLMCIVHWRTYTYRYVHIHRDIHICLISTTYILIHIYIYIYIAHILLHYLPTHLPTYPPTYLPIYPTNLHMCNHVYMRIRVLHAQAHTHRQERVHEYAHIHII